MAMFWEFLTFELRFRLKSVSTYVYFLLWFTFAFLSVASENFGPVGSQNGKGPTSTEPMPIPSTIFGSCLFGVIVIAAIFGTVDPARFPARHLPDPLHQTHLEVRLPGRPLGRFLRHHRLRLLRHCSSVPSSAPSRPGPITPASPPITSGGICSRFFPST